MENKCPKCGSTLINKTIKKQLGSDSIDYPVAQVCPTCNWNRDLTGAADIGMPVYSLPKAEPISELSGFNKFLTLALSMLVLVGIVFAYYPAAPGQIAPVASPTPTQAVNETPMAPDTSGTLVPGITPTGKAVPVKVDRYRGFLSLIQGTLRIKPGDEVVWTNEGVDPITLISSDNLFEAKLLDNGKRTNYTFLNTGTYGFYLKENNNLIGTIIVEP